MRLSWQQTYIARLWALDAFAVLSALVLAKLLIIVTGRSVVAPTQSQPIFLAISAAVWLLVLGVNGSRSWSVIGTGTEEYRRVLSGSTIWLGLGALTAVALNVSVSFLFLLLTAALGMSALLLARWQLRRWLGRKRITGKFYSAQVVVWGDYGQASRVASELARHPEYGFHVRGIANGRSDSQLAETGDVQLDSLPRITSSDPVEAMRTLGGDTLALAGGSLRPDLLKSVSWKLDPARENLLVVERLVDVAGPRIELRHIPNLSLVAVSPPTYKGAARLAKRWMDIILSGLALVLLAIPMVVVAILIRIDSPGPVLFRQTRIGYAGKPFTIYKFRTMRAGAEAELQRTLEEQGKEMTLFYKIENDPRITRLGAFLRKTSIDELPQFLNVFAGSMSMVGPRPQVPAEVELYSSDTYRRLLVKPGLSGLWQVDGRSSLTPEEGIRLDLYYVENWSIASDLVILLRTFRAVFSRTGAI